MKTEKIDIGNFTETVVWKSPSTAKNTFGEVVKTFATYKTDRAEVIQSSGTEKEENRSLQYTETFTITAHYDSAVNTKFEIEYNGEVLNILRIEKLNMNRFMRISAVKKED